MVHPFLVRLRAAAVLACLPLATLGVSGHTPDGRGIAPAGFTIPVESFASAMALSPDGRFLAVLSPDAGAVDVLDSRESVLVQRLVVPHASALTWTADGLYVARGYLGRIARFGDGAGTGSAGKAKLAGLVARDELDVGVGLVDGIAEDPATHRIALARTAEKRVELLDDATGRALATLTATGEPFSVGFAANDTLVATLYDSDHVDAWRDARGDAVRIPTGPHPTQLLVDGAFVFVANADGHDVVSIDAARMAVVAHYDLGVGPDPAPGQTPSAMVLSSDDRTLFVAESGFNDVAVVDLGARRVVARIPTGWYPTALAFASRPTVGKKDGRAKAQLWIASAKGLGSQPDPGGEWDGTYAGLVQHVVVEPRLFPAWTATVAAHDRFSVMSGATKLAPARMPPIEHVVFVVRENKQFDEEFGDEPGADADPDLVLYGRTYTPNAHELAETYTLFDDFMGNGEASIYGHAWTTQGIANDYHERNAHTRDETTEGLASRVPWSIWPYAIAGEDTVTEATMDFDWFRNLDALPQGPRMNVSGIFGPRGELIDALARKHVPFRVYGEQMTMRPDGTIDPELVAHADRDYPGAHIDFGVLDTVRAGLFLDDVAKHGLAAYSYVTLPTDHTTGTDPGFYTPRSYVASNDVALGEIVAGLSKRPDWKNTIVFTTTDDPQGTGDHVDAHRMPAIAIGPYVRRGFVDHSAYSIPSFLRTVELIFGVEPLTIFDAAAPPMFDAFGTRPNVTRYTALPSNFPIEKNPGKPTQTSFDLDGPNSREIPAQEWASIKGSRSLALHERYLRRLGGATIAVDGDDER